MSELTNIHARSVKDLTTPTELPVDPDALDQVKLVAGNFPSEYAGNEALTVGTIKELAAQGREAEIEEVIQRLNNEETRAIEAELLLTQNKADKDYVDTQDSSLKAYVDIQDSSLQAQINQKASTEYLNTALSQLSTEASKFYPTLAEANADIANIVVKQPVTIGEAINGGLWYKATAGATSLTKSPYDPLTQAKADATEKAEAAKNDAITSAATDASTKANAAENNAINYIDLKLVSFPERSGFISGICTNNEQLLIAFRASDGYPVFANGQSSLDMIEALNTSFQSKFETSVGARSGVLYGLKTPDGSLPFYIDTFTGAPILCGVDILAAIKNIESKTQNVETNIQLLPDDALVGWGDSLTGAGSSGDWLQKLANSIGWSYYNGGIGGQGSKQIASRSGAVPARFTQEFVIPATTTPITVSVNEWTPCSRSGTAQLINVKGVTGLLSRSNEDIHTFVRSEAGSEVNVSTGSYAYSVNGDLYSKRFLIVGTGRNSISTMQPHEIVATVKAMIDNQKTQIKRAIVWSIPYFPADSETQKQRIDDINVALKNAFPEYFVDIAGWLCSSSPTLFGVTTINDPFTVLGLTPTSQDLIDNANKLTPVSLRTAVDDGHFNQNCGTAIAYRMKRELEIKGWI